MKRIIPFIVLLLVGGGWWVYHFKPLDQPQYSGFIEAEDVFVGSKTGGRVLDVLVREGDVVNAGDSLIRLDHDLQTARLNEAEAALLQAMKRLQELENGTRPQEIHRAEALHEQSRQQWLLLKNGPRAEDIRAAEANVDSASADWILAAITEKRQRELYAKKNTTADTLDRAQKELSVARNRYQANLAELEKLKAGFRTEDIQAAKAQMMAASASLALAEEGPRKEQIEQACADAERAKAAVSQAKINLRETVIESPSDGVVEVSRLQPGDLLAPNQTALTLILRIPLWVRIYVPESYLSTVSIGKILTLSVASYPEKEFQGRVVQVNRKAEFTPRNVQTPQTRDDLVFGVKIEINDPDQLLRPGMVADVTIETPKKPIEN